MDVAICAALHGGQPRYDAGDAFDRLVARERSGTADTIERPPTARDDFDRRSLEPHAIAETALLGEWIDPLGGPAIREIAKADQHREFSEWSFRDRSGPVQAVVEGRKAL